MPDDSGGELARAEVLERRLREADAALEASRAALAESEDRFRTVLGSAIDYAIITTDLAGRITGWNAGAARALGWTESEVLWRDTALIFTPAERELGIPEQEMQTALEKGSAAGERWHVRRDGTHFWAQGQLTPLRNGADLRGYLRILRDRTERRAAEEALRASEARFRAVAELVPDILWSNTPQGQACWYNQRWLEYTGQTPEQVQGYGWLDVIHPDDRATALRDFEAALDAGQGLRREVRIRRSMDGSYRWFLAQARPVRDAAGTIVQWFGAATDIHEQRAAVEALGRSEARLARLLATAPAAIVEVDADGAFTYTNPAAERIVGGSLLGRRLDDPAWQPTALDGRPFRPEDLLITRVMQGEMIRDCKQLARMQDGKQRALSANAVPVRAAPETAQPEGRITGALIVFTDITERHEAEVALRRLNETLEAEVAQRTKERDRTWRLSQDLLMVARIDATLVAVNPAWTAVLGWTEGELLGRPFLDLVHPDDKEKTLAATRRLAGGLPREGRAPNRYRHQDGSWRWLAWTAVADEGLIYATGRDVTAEKEAAEALSQAEEQLRQAQKMEAVGQLTGGIAHDFNNLLQGIGGSLELVQRRVEQGRAEEAARYVETARKGVERAAALTQRLLAFARRQQLQPRPVDPDALVLGMEALIRQTVGPEVAVELRLRDGTWPVLCDANQLENALLNLAINARDATPEGGRLTIGTAHVVLGAGDVAGQEGALPGDYVEVAVSDTGTGMSADVRRRAFEPFFTTKPIGQGTGLGLSQLYGFVRQSGGIVHLESAPGQGTSVRLYLPRHEEARAAERAGTGQASPMQGADGVKAVLLVEYEHAVRELAAERLRGLGCRVLEAGDGPTALRLLRSGIRVDLLVTDVGLAGGLNGRQMADAARERRPHLPVLFITGYAGGAVEVMLPPGMAVIGKPFALDALAAKVRSMVEGG